MPANPAIRERTERIRAAALGLGFDKVGFARADDADPEGHFARWLERGCAGEMSYMGRTAAERRDPRRLVEGAQSVVALSISYFVPHAEPRGRLKVSRYALGDDYHTVVRKKVRKLRKVLLTLAPGCAVHPTVDTSAVIEREWARRAGIAWIGKSTMAIAQDLGTYTFLATLITSAELEYDAPHPNRCGSCTRCIDACPTHAFTGPYELDATKCISYWTLEVRGDFDERTPAFSDWVAGCDICQEVCPWNKFARATTEPRFQPRADLLDPDAPTFLEDDGASRLTEIVRGTALQRTGAASLRRNALHACRLSPTPSPGRDHLDDKPSGAR